MALSTVASIAQAAALGHPGAAVPLYDLDAECADARFPRVVGEWVVGCEHGGQLDLALHIPSGRRVPLEPSLNPERSAASTGEAPDVVILVEVDAETRIVELTTAGLVERDGESRFPAHPVAPPTTTALQYAVLLPDRVEALPHAARVRRPLATTPAGWYPPALVWPIVAWVERGPDHTEDLWMRTVEPPGDPVLLAGGPGFERHVVSDGDWFAWVDDEGIALWNPTTNDRKHILADSGFHAAPTLWAGIACWEERGSRSSILSQRSGVDIRCSDGLDVVVPGDQLSPSRSGPWLVYRSEGHTWLKTAP